MKILIVTNHFYPEVFRVNDVAFELTRQGHQVTVITGIPDYPQGHYWSGYGVFKKRRENVKGVQVIRVPVIPRGKGGSIRLFLNYLSYLLLASGTAFVLSFRQKFDRIFVHETSPVTVGLPAVVMKKMQKIPLYFWVLDLWPESLTAAGGITNKYILGIFNHIVCFLYRNSDKILISSRGFESSILQKGDYRGKIIYFPNWGEDILTQTEQRSDLPLLPEGFKIMYAGNIGEAQGFETIMEAAFQLKEYTDIKWILVGDGRKKAYVADFIKRYQLEHTVILAGRFPLDAMPSLLRQADLLLVSLKDEEIFNLTVPAKLQAYMATSKAVCAILNGEGAQVVREANNGCVVAAGDVQDLVVQVLRLSACSSEQLHQLGKNGYQYYEKYFKKEICMNHLMQIMNLR